MLVHCYAGQSRSVALVLAYLCSALRMQLSDAYQLVLSTRPSARPNSGVLSPLPTIISQIQAICIFPNNGIAVRLPAGLGLSGFMHLPG